MSDHADQHGTVHLVGTPGAAASGRRVFGRVSPALLCARSIAAGTTPNAPVIVVGTDRAADHARACGLTVTATVTPPLGNPRMARGAFRRIAGVAERIVCWSDELAPLAVHNAGEIELMSTRPDLCTRPHRRFTRIACYRDRDHALWSQRGASPVQIELPSIPAADAEAKALARERLGIDRPTIVLGALCDDVASANARGTAFLGTVLQETGYDITVVLPESADNLPSARRHHRARGRRFRMILTDRSPVEWLPALDFVATPHCTGTGADVCAAQLAMAAGAEIVRLGTGGKATLASAKHDAGTLLARLDAVAAASHERVTAREPAHA